MTDIKLLPLPSVLLNWPHPTNHVAIRDYARANVAHATAPLQAEIEALRAEADQHKRRGEAYFQTAERQGKRAERLAEALHKLEDSCEDSDGAQYGTLATSFVRGICKDALREYDEGTE